MPSSTIWRNPGCCFIQYGTNTKWSDLEFEIFFKNSEIQSSEVPSSTIWGNPGCFFIQYGRLKTILCRPWPLPLCKVYFIEDPFAQFPMEAPMEVPRQHLYQAVAGFPHRQALSPEAKLSELSRPAADFLAKNARYFPHPEISSNGVYSVNNKEIIGKW